MQNNTYKIILKIPNNIKFKIIKKKIKIAYIKMKLNL